MGSVWLVQRHEEINRNELDNAFRELLPGTFSAITNPYYEKQGVFTDSVERFRFDGADEPLVAQLVKKYNLNPTSQPANSKFKAPHWWQLPSSGIYYLRGAGHQYHMLVYDPANRRVFVEITQD